MAAALRRPAGERGSQRRDVVGDQPGGRRRAPRGEDRAVPGDAGRARAGDPPAAPHGRGVRPRLARTACRSPDFQRSLPPGDQRSAAFLLAVRRAGGGATLSAVRRRREAVARGDGRDRTPTPPLRCAGSPTATSSRPRWRSPTETPCPSTSRRRSPELPTVMARVGRTRQPRRQRRPQPRRGGAAGRPRGRAVRRRRSSTRTATVR